MKISNVIIFLKNYLLNRNLVVFNGFIGLHVLSYSTAILLGTTLEIPRALFALVALGTLYSPANILQAKPILYFAFVVLVSVAFSNYVGGHIYASLSVFLYFFVIYGFVDYFKKYNQNISILVYLMVFWYSLYFILSLVFANTFSLDYYADESLELLGFKSRMIGWSGAILFAFLISVFKDVKRKIWLSIFLTICAISIIGSGARSALLSVSVVIIVYVFTFQNIRTYLKIGIVFLVIMGGTYFYFENIYVKSSFFRRAELVDEGVSYDNYRKDIWLNYLANTWQTLPESILPHGEGVANFFEYKQLQLKMFDNLSTHSSILHLLIAFGLLALPIVYKIYWQAKIEIFNNGMLVFIPIVLISLTEDSFGGGQFLFPFIAYLYVK